MTMAGLLPILWINHLYEFKRLTTEEKPEWPWRTSYLHCRYITCMNLRDWLLKKKLEWPWVSQWLLSDDSQNVFHKRIIYIPGKTRWKTWLNIHFNSAAILMKWVEILENRKIVKHFVHPHQCIISFFTWQYLSQYYSINKKFLS